jgi:GNAT superfamily N-acetyltransferase
VGNVRELDNPTFSGLWNAGDGGFTVPILEGDTQFATDPGKVRAWSHHLRDQVGKPIVVEADISGLPVRFIGRTEPDKWDGHPPNLVDDVYYPSTSTGIGVIGPISVDRIKRLWLVRSDKQGDDLEFANWDEFVKYRDSGGGTAQAPIPEDVLPPDYDKDYNRGFRFHGDLDRADADGRTANNAWYDGYLDAATGRPKWTARERRRAGQSVFAPIVQSPMRQATEEDLAREGFVPTTPEQVQRARDMRFAAQHPVNRRAVRLRRAMAEGTYQPGVTQAPIEGSSVAQSPIVGWKPKVQDMGPAHRQIIDPNTERVLFDVEQDEHGVWSVHPPTVSAGLGEMFGTWGAAKQWALKYADLQRDGKELPDSEGNFWPAAQGPLVTPPMEILDEVGPPEPPGRHDLFGTGHVDGPSTTFDERLTRCYELAASALFAGAPEGSVLVHGSIHGYGAPRRIGHAWLNLPDGTVWEPITAKVYDKDAWTAYARAREERVYTKDQAAKELIGSGHYGRWHESEYPGVLPAEIAQNVMPETEPTPITFMGRPVAMAEVDASNITSTRVVTAFIPVKSGDSWEAWPVGVLTWDKDTKSIELLYVNDDAERLGLATAMYQYARSIEPGLKHSTERSPAGTAWARSTGEPVPAVTRTLTDDEAYAMGSRLVVGISGFGPEDMIGEPVLATKPDAPPTEPAQGPIAQGPIAVAETEDLTGIPQENIDEYHRMLAAADALDAEGLYAQYSMLPGREVTQRVRDEVHRNLFYGEPKADLDTLMAKEIESVRQNMRWRAEDYIRGVRDRLEWIRKDQETREEAARWRENLKPVADPGPILDLEAADARIEVEPDTEREPRLAEAHGRQARMLAAALPQGYTLFFPGRDRESGTAGGWASDGTYRGEIMRDGRPVGHFTRVFDPESGDVFNEHLDVSIPGLGVGTQWVARSVEAERAAGYKRLHVRAGLESGGIVWAKAGFQFDVVDPENDSVDSGPGFGQHPLLALKASVDPEIVAWRHMHPVAYPVADGYGVGTPTPQEMYDAGGKVRNLLKGSEWTGVMDLTEAKTTVKTGLTVFREYVARHPLGDPEAAEFDRAPESTPEVKAIGHIAQHAVGAVADVIPKRGWWAGTGFREELVIRNPQGEFAGRVGGPGQIGGIAQSPIHPDNPALHQPRQFPPHYHSHGAPWTSDQFAALSTQDLLDRYQVEDRGYESARAPDILRAYRDERDAINAEIDRRISAMTDTELDTTLDAELRRDRRDNTRASGGGDDRYVYEYQRRLMAERRRRNPPPVIPEPVPEVPAEPAPPQPALLTGPQFAAEDRLRRRWPSALRTLRRKESADSLRERIDDASMEIEAEPDLPTTVPVDDEAMDVRLDVLDRALTGGDRGEVLAAYHGLLSELRDQWSTPAGTQHPDDWKPMEEVIADLDKRISALTPPAPAEAPVGVAAGAIPEPSPPEDFRAMWADGLAQFGVEARDTDTMEMLSEALNAAYHADPTPYADNVSIGQARMRAGTDAATWSLIRSREAQGPAITQGLMPEPVAVRLPTPERMMWGELLPGDVIVPDRWNEDEYTVAAIKNSLRAPGSMDITVVAADGTQEFIQEIYPARVEVRAKVPRAPGTPTLLAQAPLPDPPLDGTRYGFWSNEMLRAQLDYVQRDTSSPQIMEQIDSLNAELARRALNDADWRTALPAEPVPVAAQSPIAEGESAADKARAWAKVSGVADWETTQPWNRSREDFAAGRVPGITLDPDAVRGWTAMWDYGNGIIINDSFFDGTPETKRGLLYHEAGHAVGFTVTSGVDIGPLMGPFRRPGGAATFDFISPFGSGELGPTMSNHDNHPSEILADAYGELASGEAGYYHDPGTDELFARVGEVATELGFPVQDRNAKPPLPTWEEWRPGKSDITGKDTWERRPAGTGYAPDLINVTRDGRGKYHWGVYTEARNTQGDETTLAKAKAAANAAHQRLRAEPPPPTVAHAVLAPAQRHTLRPMPEWLFDDQVSQYPPDGPDGVGYYKGVIDDTRHVDCLLYRKDGKILGILNYYPQDMPPYEMQGNFLVVVDPAHRREGIGTALVAEAVRRFGADPNEQQVTALGRALNESMGYDGLDSPPQVAAGVMDAAVDWLGARWLTRTEAQPIVERPARDLPVIESDLNDQLAAMGIDHKAADVEVTDLLHEGLLNDDPVITADFPATPQHPGGVAVSLSRADARAWVDAVEADVQIPEPDLGRLVGQAEPGPGVRRAYRLARQRGWTPRPGDRRPSLFRPIESSPRRRPGSLWIDRGLATGTVQGDIIVQPGDLYRPTRSVHVPGGTELISVQPGWEGTAPGDGHYTTLSGQDVVLHNHVRAEDASFAAVGVNVSAVNRSGRVTASTQGPDGKQHFVGDIGWYADGEISDVLVMPQYRMQGVATALLAYARSINPNVHHSEIQTDAGAAWASVAQGPIAEGNVPELAIAPMPDQHFTTPDGVDVTLHKNTDAGLVSDLAGGNRVTASVDGSRIGELRWYGASPFRGGEWGEISSVFVTPDYRMQGVATAMLGFARQVDPDVHHSDVLTPDGAAWSQVAAGPIAQGDIAWVNDQPPTGRPYANYTDARLHMALWDAADPTADTILEEPKGTPEQTARILAELTAEDDRRKGRADGLTPAQRLEKYGLTLGTMPPTGGPVQRLSPHAKSIMASVNGEYVGHIFWNENTGEVEDIYVHDEFQRLGVGTTLWVEAKARDPKVHHSPTQTEAGRAWAQVVQAPLMPGQITEQPGDEHYTTPSGQDVLLHNHTQPWEMLDESGGRVSAAIRTDFGWQMVGSLWWHGGEPESATNSFEWYQPGEIGYVSVDPQYRMQGIATEMLRFARTKDPRVSHSPVQSREGAAWAQVAQSDLPQEPDTMPAILPRSADGDPLMPGTKAILNSRAFKEQFPDDERIGHRSVTVVSVGRGTVDVTIDDNPSQGLPDYPGVFTFKAKDLFGAHGGGDMPTGYGANGRRINIGSVVQTAGGKFGALDGNYGVVVGAASGEREGDWWQVRYEGAVVDQPAYALRVTASTQKFNNLAEDLYIGDMIDWVDNKGVTHTDKVITLDYTSDNKVLVAIKPRPEPGTMVPTQPVLTFAFKDPVRFTRPSDLQQGAPATPEELKAIRAAAVAALPQDHSLIGKRRVNFEDDDELVRLKAKQEMFHTEASEWAAWRDGAPASTLTEAKPPYELYADPSGEPYYKDSPMDAEQVQVYIDQSERSAARFQRQYEEYYNWKWNQDPEFGRLGYKYVPDVAPDGGPGPETLAALDTVREAGAKLSAAVEARYQELLRRSGRPDPALLEAQASLLDERRANLIHREDQLAERLNLAYAKDKYGMEHPNNDVFNIEDPEERQRVTRDIFGPGADDRLIASDEGKALRNERKALAEEAAKVEAQMSTQRWKESKAMHSVAAAQILAETRPTGEFVMLHEAGHGFMAGTPENPEPPSPEPSLLTELRVVHPPRPTSEPEKVPLVDIKVGDKVLAPPPHGVSDVIAVERVGDPPPEGTDDLRPFLLTVIDSTGGTIKARFDVANTIASGKTPALDAFRGGRVEIGNTPDPVALKALTEALNMYPADWVRLAAGRGPLTLNPDDGTQRGSYVVDTNSLNLPKAPGDERPEHRLNRLHTATHETGHMMEQSVPGLKALEWAYHTERTTDRSKNGAVMHKPPEYGQEVGRRRRSGRNAMQPLAKLTGVPYPDWEQARADDYVHPYSGKGYAPGGPDGMRELFTTMVESLLAGSRYTDDDSQAWVLGVLATL